MADRSFQFLFQTDRGRIDGAVWWKGTVPLTLIAAALSAGWMLLRPYAFHDLAKTPFIDGATLVAYAYLVFFAFAVILIAICQYNLSAKRFRDRGRPAALAAVLPLTLLLAGSLIWFIPRSFGDVPDWAAPLALVAILAVAMWNVLDLGFGPTVAPHSGNGPGPSEASAP